MKTLLVAAALCVGVSAWGAGYTPTLTDKLAVAGYKYKAFYNISNTNVDGMCPTDGDLRYRGSGFGLFNYGSGNKSADVTLDFSKDDIIIFDFKDSQSRDVTINSVENCTKDATLSSSTGFLVYKADADAGATTSINVGRAGCIIAILVMEVDDAVETADYTINYKSGEDIIKTVAGSGVAVGTEIPIESSFFKDDVKYLKDGGEPSTLTVASGGSTLNVAVSVAPTYSYTVKAKAGATELKVLASGSIYSGEAVNVPYPKYFNFNGTLYTRAATNKEYRQNVAITEDNQNTDFSYSATDKTNIIYYSEGEEISGATINTSATNVTIRSSNAAVGDGTNVAVCTLPAGTYKFTIGQHMHRSGYSGTVTLNIGAEEFEYTTTNVNVTESISDEITVADNTAVTFTTADNGHLDYVYIQKVSTTNEIVGTVDYSTTFNGQNKAMTINKGQTINVAFKNHGNGVNNWFNWLVRLSGTTGVDHTLRADNYVIGDDGSTVSTRSITEDGGTINWSHFLTDMQNSTVTMTITYAANGTFSITATSTGASHTYVHNFSYNDAKSGAINVELGVEHAWLEVTSTSQVATATIGTTGWTTFANASPLDLSSMTASKGEVTAYYASAVGGGNVTMTSTDQAAVAAGEGIMLKGTAGATITIPVVANGTAISGNKLVGCTTSTKLDADANYYVLVNNGGTAEFQRLDTKGATIPAGKAYLNASGAGAKSLKIVFDNETLGISDAARLNGNAEGMGEKAIYNLSGQRIAAPQKGINIIGGRKVVVK